MTRIILCMIVKNEARVLTRALASVIPVIDAACICDTGSTDDTVAIAHDVLSRAEVPHHLVPHEWVNFGVNRTRSFEETRFVARKLGWDLDETYALFLDADMVLKIGGGFDPGDLSAGGYMLRQGKGDFHYYNTRLAQLSVDWKCIGATHEFWAAPEGTSVERLESLWIHDVGDGGSKAGKFERDIEMLEAELERDPDNPRTIFYLAQSYFDLGDFEKARGLYEERAGLLGWEEETWYAAYRMGMCSLQLDEWDRAAGELMTAWQRRPTRAEPLYQLSRAARKRGYHHIAMLAAEQAVKIPFPEDDTLFIEGAAYHHGPVEEISVSGYYTGALEQGMAACDALLHDRSTPREVRNLTVNNVAYYARPVKSSTSRRVDIPFNVSAPHYSPMNNSICRVENGYVLLNRLVDYYQFGATSFATRDPSGKYHSRNAWLTLDNDLNTTSAAIIDDSVVEERATLPYDDARVCGVEDIRIIQWRGEWWFVGVSSQFDRQNRPRVVLGHLDLDGPKMDHIVPLDSPGRQPIEKNWVPLIHEDRLLLLYSSDPTVILQPDPDSGECEVVHRASPPVDLRRYRGSSQLVALEDGRYVYTIHEVPWFEERRVYVHRFVEMDSNLTITRASRLFSLIQRGVEYTCGLCLSHDNREVIMSCNWEDRESWLVTVPRQQVEEMLIPLEDLARFGTDGNQALLRGVYRSLSRNLTNSSTSSPVTGRRGMTAGYPGTR